MGSSYSASQILYICALAAICVLSVLYITYCSLYSQAINNPTDESCDGDCMLSIKATLYGMFILAVLLMLIGLFLQNR
jgi:hypothetical protein